MRHIVTSGAPPVSTLGSRVFSTAAQQNPLAVCTRALVAPGRLPVCHRFGALASHCDVNPDATINVADVRRIIDEALGVWAGR